MYFLNEKVVVFGEHEANTLEQIKRSTASEVAIAGALCADGHLGYGMPIGGVAAYEGYISPSGIGFDISCGNKAVLLDADATEVRANIKTIMDDIWQQISFGVGRKNNETVEHSLFEDDPAWDIEIVKRQKKMAREQLGTVGSGNHYVDLFIDEQQRVWCGVHFGSRGLGHHLATHYIKMGGGKDGVNVDPVLLAENSQLGQEYLAAMQLAGRYAYAGRDWVCQKVARILGAHIVDEIHNHHNYAWLENHFGKDLWVVRKGATPAFPGQRCLVRRTAERRRHIRGRNRMSKT